MFPPNVQLCRFAPVISMCPNNEPRRQMLQKIVYMYKSYWLFAHSSTLVHTAEVRGLKSDHKICCLCLYDGHLHILQNILNLDPNKCN